MNELQQRFIRARRQAIALNYQHLNDKQREAGLSPDAVLLTDGRLTVHVPDAQSLEALRCLHAAFLETKDHS